MPPEGDDRTEDLFAYARRRQGDGADRVSPEDRPVEARPASESMASEDAAPFVYEAGIHLRDSVLWCDADRSRHLSFVSHGHQTMTGKSGRVLATAPTLTMLRRGRAKFEALAAPYGQRFQLGDLALEMHPSGHMLGAAQLLIERAGQRLLYSSDLCFETGCTTAPAPVVEAEVLVLPAPRWSPSVRVPSRAEVVDALLGFVADALAAGDTPILLVEAIGMGQELAAILEAAGHKMRVHGSVFEGVKAYRKHGVPLAACRRFQGKLGADEVLLFPPILRFHQAVRSQPRPKLAGVGASTLAPGFAAQHRLDAVFPLVDSADHEALQRHVLATGARSVLLTGGAVEPFGYALRQKGIRVEPLGPPTQLTLW